MNSDDELARSYHWCYRVARRSRSSFYRAFWLLEKPQRDAMFALYAFARISDDLSDGTDPLDTRSAKLVAWQNMLREQLHTSGRGGALATGSSTAPLWPALRHTVHTYRIPVELLEDLVTGVAMDLGPVRLTGWPEVDRYCYYVASTVGLACTSIWQADDTLPKQPAIDCGLAFQLTNILRDVREDAVRNRIYLPITELEKYGCDTESWLAGAPRGDWLALVSDVVERARSLYASGLRTMDHLPGRGARMFWLMWSSYRQLLETVDRQKEKLWSQRRIQLSRTQRLRLLLQAVAVSKHSTEL